jgi:hypothetical protein
VGFPFGEHVNIRSLMPANRRKKAVETRVRGRVITSGGLADTREAVMDANITINLILLIYLVKLLSRV